MHEIVDEFRQFLGEESFARFLRDLHTDCKAKNRLKFWQEKRWSEFCNRRGMEPWALDEILDTFLEAYPTWEDIEEAFPRGRPREHESLKSVECSNPPSDLQAEQLGLVLHRVAPFDPFVCRHEGRAVHLKTSRDHFVISDYNAIDSLLSDLEDVDGTLDAHDRFDRVMELLAEFRVEGANHGLDADG